MCACDVFFGEFLWYCLLVLFWLQLGLCGFLLEQNMSLSCFVLFCLVFVWSLCQPPEFRIFFGVEFRSFVVEWFCGKKQYVFGSFFLGYIALFLFKCLFGCFFGDTFGILCVCYCVLTHWRRAEVCGNSMVERNLKETHFWWLVVLCVMLFVVLVFWYVSFCFQCCWWFGMTFHGWLSFCFLFCFHGCFFFAFLQQVFEKVLNLVFSWIGVFFLFLG